MEWTRESFEEALGYWRARTLHCAIELDVFSPLEAGPAGAAWVARAVGAEPQATELLLDALAGLELLDKAEDGYALAPFAREHLLPGHVGYLGDIALALARDWELWGTLSERVREGRQRGREDVFSDDPTGARLLERGLRADAMELAPALMDRLEGAGLDLSGRRELLDVGGGHAVYSATLCARHPRLKATIFDLPVPLEIARETIAQVGLDARIRLVAGDYRFDPLPPGHDLTLLSYVLHGAGPAHARRLIERVHQALAPGGMLLIQELVVTEDRTRPASAAVFGLNLLLHTAQGRCLTRTELLTWIDQAGFAETSDVAEGTFVALKPA